MSTSRHILKGGRVIDAATGFDGRADVLVEEGIIVAVGADVEASDAEVIDVTDRIVVPGLVDLCARVGNPSGDEAKDVTTLGRAAVRGGYTDVCVVPDEHFPLNRPADIRSVRLLATELSPCRLHVAGALTYEPAEDRLAEVALMRDAGAKALVEGGGVGEAGFLRRALRYARMVDLPVTASSIDPSLDNGGMMHEGEMSVRLGLPGSPEVAEALGLARLMLLAADTGCRVHVGPISTARSVREVARAKAEGVPLTASTTFHHLVLTEEAVSDFRPFTKVRPPLRTEADRRALIDGLARGIIDYIVTDHTPHRLDETDVEWARAAFGVVGLEMAVALSVTHLIEPGHLSWLDWVKRTSWAPARWLGVPAGRIEAGRPADLAVIDPRARWQVDAKRIGSGARNTPFDGWSLTGRVVETWVAGRRFVH